MLYLNYDIFCEILYILDLQSLLFQSPYTIRTSVVRYVSSCRYSGSCIDHYIL